VTAAFSTFLALRYLRSRWINVLGTIGVMLGVWALIVVIAVFSGFVADIRGQIRGATPDLLCSGLRQGTSFAAVNSLLADDPDIVASAPRLRHSGMYFPHGRLGSRTQATRGLVANALAFDYVNLLGIDPVLERGVIDLDGFFRRIEDAQSLPIDIADPFRVDPREEQEQAIRARNPAGPGALLSASPGMLVSQRRMDTSLLRRGQRTDVVTGRFALVADETDLLSVRRAFAIAGAFESGHRILDETTALVPIDVMRGMFGFAPDDPFAETPQDIVSDVAFRVRDGADLAAVAARVDRTIQPQFGGRTLTWEQQNSVFLGAIEQERAMMKLVLFAVMLVAASLIFATLHMTVMQKVKDIGILCSMGASPGGVQQVFLLSGLVVGITGAILGVLTGVLSAIYLNDVNDWSRERLGLELFPTEVYALARVPYRLEVTWIVQVAVAALIVAFLAAWLPARRAARMDPVRALAYE
jgi:ABC-type lipoprotein release transport system permease subunit